MKDLQAGAVAPPHDGSTLPTESPGKRPDTAAGAWAKKLALLAVSSLLMLALLEAGLRVAGYQPLYRVYSKPEVFWRHDRLAGWSLQPGATGTYVGPRPFPVEFRARVRINSLGLRGPEIGQLPPGGRRVLVLGDSETAGFEVPEGQTYVSLLAKRLTELRHAPVQVVNGGVRGYGTDQAYLLYQGRLRALRPDVVVYDTSPNDPDDDVTLHRVRRPFGKPAFALGTDGSLRLVGTPVPGYPLCTAYRLDDQGRIQRVDRFATRLSCHLETALADHSALFSFAVVRIQQHPGLIGRLWNLGNPEGEAPPPAGPAAAPPAAPPAGVPPVPAPVAGTPSSALDYPHRLTSALIARMAAQARSDGARFLLVGNEADLRQLDIASIQHEGAEVARADDVLGADQRAVRFPNDGHLTPDGHRRIADLLTPRIAALLP